MISPMMEHYLQTKEKYHDCILFYRLGDFYEFFFEDATLMSDVLDLTLTGKDCGLEERAPMCGIPHHASEGYINKLILLGYKVAICEQTTVPQKGVKIVERQVVRVVTPGTAIDENLLDEKRNNYIASICFIDNAIGFSYLDISTGEFKCATYTGDDKILQLNDSLTRVMPAEVLCNSSVDFENQLAVVKLNYSPKFFMYQDNCYEFEKSNLTLKGQFGENFEERFQLKKQKQGICASGALLDYIKETQKRSLVHINSLFAENASKFMVLDINTRRNLELLETMKDKRKKGSLLSILDKTKTSMGAREIRSYLEQPLCDDAMINKRLNGVEELFKNIILRDNISSLLSNMCDIERISARISYGNFNPKDCLALGISLQKIPQIKKQLQLCKSSAIVDICDNLEDFSAIVEELNRAIMENPCTILSQGGYIKEGYNKELDEYRYAKTDGNNWIIKLEQREREQTAIKNLKISFNKVYGYFFEVNKSMIAQVPLNYVRKQTVANNERFITEELKEIESKILGAEENAVKLEQKLFAMIREGLISYIPALQNTAKHIAMLDALLSFATISSAYNYVKPQISKNVDCIEIVEGRHPVVEQIQKQFISNDVKLDCVDNKTIIITGPNMAGKSTYMRQVALITLLAHIGCFVPAKTAKISLTDRIFTRVGASDDLAFGQSTFMVEMSELANILDNATDKSLIILDEIGRGTSTFDGLSIAWSTVEYLCNNMKSKTLFATHYHELTELENFIGGVKNYKISVKEIGGSIVFLRKIVRGGANKSFGVEVASLAGVNQKVIERAKQISSKLENNDTHKMISIEGENQSKTQEIIEKDKNYNQIISILKDVNINNISPMSAFEILADICEKLK